MIFHLSHSFVLVALLLFAAVAAQAAELKPFLTLQTAGSSGLIAIAEKFSAAIDPSDSAGIKTSLAPFKNIPGVDSAGRIGIALLENDENPMGIEAVIFLPIRDFKTFNNPMIQAMLSPMGLKIKQDGTKYTIASPAGEIVGYQKTGYFAVATAGAAEFAAAADQKKVFAEIEKFTLGIHVNLENISLETVEKLLKQGVMSAAILGADPKEMGLDIEIEAVLEQIESYLNEFSAFTAGLTLDARTLDLTASLQITPLKDAEWAEKINNVKNVKTPLGAFLPDTPQTVFSGHYLDYLTDSEMENILAAWKAVTEGFMEGFTEAVEGEEEAEKLKQTVDIGLKYVQGTLDFLADERLIDAVCSLDTDGTLILAMASENTGDIVKLDDEFFGSLLETLAGTEGKESIESKIKRNEETIAGYALSSVQNPFADLPESVNMPGEMKAMLSTVPVNFFRAVKDNEAAVYAFGLDFAKTEKTLKDALTKTSASPQPKQTAVFGLKPFCTLLQKQYMPFMEALMGPDEQAAAMIGKMAAADAGAKITLTTEYPGDAILYKTQVDGKFINTCLQILIVPSIAVAQGAAQRMACTNNIKQILLALHDYHDTCDALPPLYTVDEEGNPLHSWRVLILPFIGQQALYQQINLDEPWDSEHN